MALSKEDVESYLKTVDLRGPLEIGLNAAVSAATMKPDHFFAGFFKTKAMLANSGCAAARSRFAST